MIIMTVFDSSSSSTVSSATFGSVPSSVFKLVAYGVLSSLVDGYTLSSFGYSYGVVSGSLPLSVLPP